jgi:hypothetical protein
MMRFISLLVFISVFPSLTRADGPISRHKDGKVQQEFEQVYQDLRVAGRIASRTLAELQALTPSRAGLVYYCSDCTTDGLVVSTGTTVGAFGRSSAKTTTIN